MPHRVRKGGVAGLSGQRDHHIAIGTASRDKQLIICFAHSATNIYLLIRGWPGYPIVCNCISNIATPTMLRKQYGTDNARIDTMCREDQGSGATPLKCKLETVGCLLCLCCVEYVSICHHDLSAILHLDRA